MNSLPQFRLLKPTTAAAAVGLRADHPTSRFIAGGTDILPNLRRGLVKSDILIDLGGIAELSSIRAEPDALSIGAGTTLAAIAAHPVIVDRLPALAEAAGAVAGPTHRATATLGGNLCLDTRCQYYNQSESWRQANDYCLKLDGDTCRVSKKSPRCLAAFSGDVAPALMALDATVELLGPHASRRIPIRELYVDDGKTWLAIAPDEMVRAVQVPVSAGWLSIYEKIRVRGAIDFPLVGVAVALARKDGVLSGLRIACTGMASCPVAIDGLDTLLGRPLNAAGLDLIAERIEPVKRAAVKTTVTDLLYRRRVTPVLVRRLVQRLWDDPVWTA